MTASLCITIPEAFFPWSQSSQFIHMFDLDHVIFIRSSTQSQKHTLVEARVHNPCTCLIWTMSHSSEALHNPRSMLLLKPEFTLHALVWFGPCYIHQKLNTIAEAFFPWSQCSQCMSFFELDHPILIRNSAQFSWIPQFTVRAFVSFGLFYFNMKLFTVTEEWLQFAHLFDLDHLILIRNRAQSQKHTFLDVIILSPGVMPCIPAHLFTASLVFFLSYFYICTMINKDFFEIWP